MRTLVVVAVIALVGFGAGVWYISAQGSGSASSGALTAQDYADIQQLYWRYNHGADFRDADLFASAFTEPRRRFSGCGFVCVGVHGRRRLQDRS